MPYANPNGYAGTLGGAGSGGCTVTFTAGGGPITAGTVSLVGSEAMSLSGGTSFMLASGTLSAASLMISNSVNLGGNVVNGDVWAPSTSGTGSSALGPQSRQMGSAVRP